MPSDRREFVALCAAALGATAGCIGGDAGGPNPSADVPGNDDTPETDDPAAAVAAGNANFGFDVLDLLATEEADANYTFSPYSAGVALAMTYGGARGDTRDEMRKTLHFDVDDVHAAWRELSDRVSTDAPSDEDGQPFVLRDANAVWGQTGFPWREEYTDLLSAHYGAGVREVDFETDTEGARKRINDWTAEQTEGTIEKVIEKGALTAMTRLVLANAVYFRANWREEFDPDATESASFTRLDGSTTDVQLMANSDTYRYHDGDRVQAVSLPYVGSEVEMLVVLPDAGAFADVREDLDAERLAAIADSLESEHGTVSLPKFGFSNKHDLKKVLSDLGMGTAFSDDADFTGMASGAAGEDLRLDDVVQRTYLDVDEQGTEAAAVTAVENAVTSAPRNPFEFTVDRPFLYAIRHRETGAVFFLGQVTTP